MREFVPFAYLLDTRIMNNLRRAFSLLPSLTDGRTDGHLFFQFRQHDESKVCLRTDVEGLLPSLLVRNGCIRVRMHSVGVEVGRRKNYLL